MEQRIIIIGRTAGKRAYIKALETIAKAGFSVQDLQTVTEKLTLAFKSASKSVEEFRNITKVEKLQNPRGVIPEKYKNNIHAGNRIKKR